MEHTHSDDMLGFFVSSTIEQNSNIVVVDYWTHEILYQGDTELLPARLSGYEVCSIAPQILVNGDSEAAAFIRILVQNTKEGK